jgi:DNA-directed RNA polymerase specialized sigma24 family protein
MDDPDTQEITVWLNRLKTGDGRAVEVIWKNYFEQLASRARKLLDGNRRDADEEDIALSAIDSFVQRARDGRFPQLDDRDDLARLLFCITARKVTARRRQQGAAKRPPVVDRQALAGTADDGGEHADELLAALGREPSPELVAEFSELFRRLLDRLEDSTLQRIVELKLCGHTHREIAEQLGTYERAIERKLQIIRRTWLDVDPE